MEKYKRWSKCSFHSILICLKINLKGNLGNYWTYSLVSHAISHIFLLSSPFCPIILACQFTVIKEATEGWMVPLAVTHTSGQNFGTTSTVRGVQKFLEHWVISVRKLMNSCRLKSNGMGRIIFRTLISHYELANKRFNICEGKGKRSEMNVR